MAAAVVFLALVVVAFADDFALPADFLAVPPVSAADRLAVLADVLADFLVAAVCFLTVVVVDFARATVLLAWPVRSAVDC